VSPVQDLALLASYMSQSGSFLFDKQVLNHLSSSYFNTVLHHNVGLHQDEQSGQCDKSKGESFAQGLLSVDVPSLSVKDHRRQARGRGGYGFALIEHFDKEFSD
jgi:hypothetical protein